MALGANHSAQSAATLDDRGVYAEDQIPAGRVFCENLNSWAAKRRAFTNLDISKEEVALSRDVSGTRFGGTGAAVASAH